MRPCGSRSRLKRAMGKRTVPLQASSRYPTTPDGRYFVVRGILWRCSNPQLPETVRQDLVKQLMTARREVKAAKASGDDDALKDARSKVQRAKVGLGERGPVWWDDGADDFNRHKVANTPYAAWHAALTTATV